jgi:hypothetical protein
MLDVEVLCNILIGGLMLLRHEQWM